MKSNKTQNMFSAFQDSDSDQERKKKTVKKSEPPVNPENKDINDAQNSIFSKPAKSKKNKKKDKANKKGSSTAEKDQPKTQKTETAEVPLKEEPKEEKTTQDPVKGTETKNDLLNDLSVPKKPEPPIPSPTKPTTESKISTEELRDVLELKPRLKEDAFDKTNQKKFDPFVFSNLNDDLKLGKSISYNEDFLKKDYNTPMTNQYQGSGFNRKISKTDNPDNKWVNEKKDFFEYLKYLLYEDCVFSYKEIAWLRRVLCKFCNLEPPINSKGKPVSLFYKKGVLYAGNIGVNIPSIDDYDEDIYFTGFLKGNGPKKELFYGRLFVENHYEVTLYQGAFKENGLITGKNLRLYSPTGVLEWEGDI